MIPQTVFGLPAHVLVIHSVVVLLPLSALGVVLLVTVRRLRPTLQWPVLAVLTVAAVSVPVGIWTGNRFYGRLLAEGAIGGPVEEKVVLHQALGTALLWPVLALWVLTVAFVALTRSRRHSRRTGLLAATGVLALVAALGSTVQVVRTGHAGATAVWNPAG